MELDDLKTAWQTLDRRLEQQAQLNFGILKQGKLDRMQSSLRPLFWGQIAQIAFGVAMILFGVSFWKQHSDVPHLLLAGLSVHVYGVISIVFAGVTLGMISRIDYAAPVLAIQKQLTQLRRIYIINGMCLGLSWWLLWVVVVTMLVMNGTGADLFVNVPSFVYGSLAAGIIGLLGTWWFLRWSRNPRRPRLAQVVDDSVTGSSLRRAKRFLEDIKQFEQV